MSTPTLTPDIKGEVEIELLDGTKFQRVCTQWLTRRGEQGGYGIDGFLTLVTRSKEPVRIAMNNGRTYPFKITIHTESINLNTIASWKATSVNIEEAPDGQDQR